MSQVNGRPGTPHEEMRAKRQAIFLRRLAEGASVRTALEDAKVLRPTAYKWRYTDPAFAQAWAEAIDDATDRLEDAAFQRAIEHSDRMLEFLLKARRPDIYKERPSVAINVDGNVAIEDTRPSIDSLIEGTVATVMQRHGLTIEGDAQEVTPDGTDD